MDYIESIEKGKYTVKIVRDEDSSSPREWDNLGTFVNFHSKYNIGDENEKTDFIEYMEQKFNFNEDYDDQQTYIDRMMEKFSEKHIVLPVYMYDHSGITINTTGFHCPWDSGQVGFIYVSKEKVRKEYGWKLITKKRIETIEHWLNNEIKILDQYLTGEVYGFEIEDENEDIIDSCYGFYGMDDVKAQALDIVDHLLESDKKEK